MSYLQGVKLNNVRAERDRFRAENEKVKAMSVEMYHVPKNEMPCINSIWAFVSVDPGDGNEGVCAATIGGVTLPLIAADERRLAILTPIAENIALRTGRVVQLVRFHQREVIKQIDGSNASG